MVISHNVIPALLQNGCCDDSRLGIFQAFQSLCNRLFSLRLPLLPFTDERHTLSKIGNAGGDNGLLIELGAPMAVSWASSYILAQELRFPPFFLRAVRVSTRVRDIITGSNHLLVLGEWENVGLALGLVSTRGRSTTLCCGSVHARQGGARYMNVRWINLWNLPIWQLRQSSRSA